ncbi:MAG: hypothetical protein NTX24_00785 [Candidatus Pacearchaeota archaeon]|nr:hypothetical protein [Candidatus Pacearchaeota archaeon]
MTNRRKRLERGIESLQEQINFHEQKRQKAIEVGDFILENYYGKEIRTYKRNKSKKEKQLNKIQ